MIKSGISQIGGKFRLRKELLANTPYHEFFLSLFSGSCIYELNKPRCRYECFNDKNADLINYFLMAREYPKEFDEMKQGIFGLVSQEICNRIVNGKLQPKNDLERAYFFYYLNKLSYGGDYEVKGYAGLNQNRAIPQTTFHKKDIENIKAHYCGIMQPTDPIRQPQVKKIKAQFRGIIMAGFQNKVDKAKANFQGITPKASYKGINPKTTRPYTNNDCGLLTPLDPKCIKRLRYVNLTAYDFTKVYDLFYKAFYERKGLEKECFIYADPPYPGTEKYYGKRFDPKLHEELISRILKTPFNFMLSIGGKCEELYVVPLKEAGWIIKEVFTKYSMDASSQNPIKEYLIMNYDINKVPKMIMDNQSDIMKFASE